MAGDVREGTAGALFLETQRVQSPCGELLPPEAKADLEDLAQYILRNPFSVEKMTLESPTDTVIYRSRLNAKINCRL